MHHQSRCAVLWLFASTVLAGCSDSLSTSPDAPISASVSRDQIVATPAELDSVSRGFARALATPGMRTVLLNAMRRSEFVDGQIDARSFFGSSASAALTRAIERANGWNGGSLVARLQKYPGFTIQMPLQSQRLQWQGLNGVDVAATLNTDASTVTGYRADGSATAITAATAAARTEVLVLLAPKEAANLRATQRSNGPIETDGEMQMTGRITYVSAAGDTIRTTVAEVAANRVPELTIMSTSGSTSDTTRLDSFQATGYEDGAGSMEIRLRTKFYRPDGTLDGSVTYEFNGVNQGTTYNPANTLIARRIPDASTARINIEVWEDDCDCFGNNDDYYGQRDFTIGDRGQVRGIFGGTGGYQDDWTNIELDWTPKAAPVATSVSLAVTSLEIPVGGWTGFTATVKDQYGYTMPGVSPSTWNSVNPAVLDLLGSGVGASGTGVSEGYSVVQASYGSLAASAYITVTSGGGGGPPCPDNQIQCNQQRGVSPEGGLMQMVSPTRRR